jgi:hypothetical protein
MIQPGAVPPAAFCKASGRSYWTGRIIAVGAINVPPESPSGRQQAAADLAWQFSTLNPADAAFKATDRLE